MAYTKNRVPYKTLHGKTQIFLHKDPVICYNYEVQDKLSPRSYETRIIGYTQAFGTCWVRKHDRCYKLAKSPTPIIESDLENEEETESEEPPEQTAETST